MIQLYMKEIILPIFIKLIFISIKNNLLLILYYYSYYCTFSFVARFNSFIGCFYSFFILFNYSFYLFLLFFFFYD